MNYNAFPGNYQGVYTAQGAKSHHFKRKLFICSIINCQNNCWFPHTHTPLSRLLSQLRRTVKI